MNLWTLKLVRITINFLRISTSSVTSQASRTMLRTEGHICQRGQNLELEVTDLELAEVLHLSSGSLFIVQCRGGWALCWNCLALPYVLSV